MKHHKIIRHLSFFVPPIYRKIKTRIYEKILPKLDMEFRQLNLSGHALQKLIRDYKFTTVLDVGSGAGLHARILKDHKKRVTALDFGTSIYAEKQGNNYDRIDSIQVDFLKYKTTKKFDCVWASHVLEHQNNPGAFIIKCMELVKDNGIIAITIPPMEDYVLGGHLTNWNAGLLLYNLVFNGIDCSDCSIMTYGYNISVIVKNKKRKAINLTYDNGDVSKLLQYFPACVKREPFNGNIKRWNW